MATHPHTEHAGLRRRFVVARVDGVPIAEGFLVAAIATVLIVRFYLWATGYPQVGGGGLHVAHVLWGGLLMLTGVFVIALRLGLPAVRLGAVLAGVGFGLFIDEVGKFLTSDVNYFFQPAIAIIYVVFMVLAILLAIWRRRLQVDRRTALANALSLADVAMNDPAASDERASVLALLAKADPADPLVPVLAQRVRDASHRLGTRAPTGWQRRRIALAAWYRRVADRPWFDRALVVLFALVAATTLALTALAFANRSRMQLGVADWCQIGGSLASAVLIVLGLLALRRSRLMAYRWFERAVLVDLLITQVFAFYQSPGWGLVSVLVDLALLVSLRYAIAREATPQQR